MPEIAKKVFFAFSAAIFFFSLTTAAKAAEIDLKWITEGEGNYFEISGSEYLNIKLQSSEVIKLRMKSFPEMITMTLESGQSSAASTEIRLAGFAPLTAYYKYEDDYHNLEKFITDENGEYNYLQDLSKPHLIFIQPRASTKYIKDNATGGDCASIGLWNQETKTCLLTTDVNETIQIDNDGLTLDGNNFEIAGHGTGYGVYVGYKKNIALKNLKVRNFGSGIFLYNATNNTVTNNTLSYNSVGIWMESASSNFLKNNKAFSNANFGIYIMGYSANNVLRNNEIFDNQLPMRGDGYNFYIRSFDWSAFGNDIDNTNLIDGKPVYYIENADGRTYENLGDTGMFFCIKCNNVSLKNFSVNSINSETGLYLWKTNNSLVENLNINKSGIGARVEKSYNNVLRYNFIHDNRVGVSIDNSSSGNLFYRNNFFKNSHMDIWNAWTSPNSFFAALPEGGNYWEVFDEPKEGCNDLNNDNLCDAPYIQKDYISDIKDNFPWTKQNGWLIVNHPLAISDLGQFKSDAETPVMESSRTGEGAIIFKTSLFDQDNDKVKFQVELKEKDSAFDGQGLLESELANSSSTVSIMKEGLADGFYKWRGRAIDENGMVSEWQEFGAPANVDFEVKTVPLYTQVFSPYPSEEATLKWSGEKYANGAANYNGSCGLTIAQCGCALTSAVMILRYHNITEANNESTDPKNLNVWLNNNKGYVGKGSLSWLKISEYSANKLKYDFAKSGDHKNNYSILDDYLSQNQPAIAKEAVGRGGILREHFLVIDDKLAKTYGVKDPAWYNTKKLNETTDSLNKIRGYDNGFDGLRLFYPSDGLAQAGFALNLASPAELLVIDSLGRKLGQDPTAGTAYDEIPEGSYISESVSDPAEEMPASSHQNKSIYIGQPVEGQYELQVIGTGSGDYSLDFIGYDGQGAPHSETFSGIIEENAVIKYDLDFSPDEPEKIKMKIIDETPPEAKIYFDKENKKLKVEGIDDLSQTEVEKQGNEFIVKDQSNNTLKLSFSQLKEAGKQIKAELKRMEYSNQETIEPAKTRLNFEWSIDKTSQSIKELEQKIDVSGQLEIQAKYNRVKNSTRIKIKTGGEERTKNLPGIAIVKLTTKKGVLGFEIE